MNGGKFKPRRRRMGIHFRLGPDEPGFIIAGIHCRLLHRQMGHPRACCSNFATHDAQNRWSPHGTNASRASRCSMRHTSHISCVHKNTVGDEIWCSFLSNHAFLLDNGQTYATRGVPYYRVSRIFMSRIFHPCNMVPHFHVPQFHVSHFQRPRFPYSWSLRR